MFFQHTVVRDIETYIDWNLPKTHAIGEMGPGLHIDYIRRRLSQDYSTESGDVVAPELLESLLPEQVLLDLKHIDWETCDLQIAAAIGLRLIWLWDLRCDQYDAHVYLTGDDTVYQRLRGALLTQLDSKPKYRPARELAVESVPLYLPSCDNAISHNPHYQQQVRRAFERVGDGIAKLGEELGIDTNPDAVASVFHAFDSYYRAYASVAHLLIAQKGKASHNICTRSRTENLIEFTRPRRSLSTLLAGKRTSGTGLNIAFLALNRLQKLWKAFYNSPAAVHPLSAEVNAAYRAEINIIYGSLISHPINHELFRKSMMLLPPYLYRHEGSRSISTSLDQSSRNLERFLEELLAVARLREESIELSVTSPEFNRWFSQEHRTRYRLVFNMLAAATPPSEADSDMAHPYPYLEGNAAPSDMNSDWGTFGEVESTIEVVPKVGSTGRPAASVDYDTAVQAWWDLADDMAPRRPTQQDVCDRLAEIGVHIAVRTLRQRVFNWRREGHRWPGPRPDSEAA